jgi:integrase
MGRDGRGVRAISKTSIEITFTYRGERCRERLKLEPTTANLKAAARHKAAIEDSIVKGTFDYAVTFPDSSRAASFVQHVGRVVMVEAYLDDWLKQQKPLLKASTYIDYTRTVIGHLTPAFGSLSLASLTRAKIREWCAELECGNKRIANLLSPLRIALQQATEDELIQSNPLYGWTYRRKAAVKEHDDIDPFSPDEQAAILSAMTGGGQNFTRFAFWTGLRTSELVALEWGDIDWLRYEMRITRAETEASDEPETTKTKAGTRTVKLLAPAIDALVAQKSVSFLHQSGRVWLNPRTNEPWTGDQAIRKTLWTHALKRAGVRYRRPYQTRHTYASMMLSAGESPMWVASQMGHTDWTMIARIYGKWIPAADPNAGGRAVAAFADIQQPTIRSAENGR